MASSTKHVRVAVVAIDPISAYNKRRMTALDSMSQDGRRVMRWLGSSGDPASDYHYEITIPSLQTGGTGKSLPPSSPWEKARRQTQVVGHGILDVRLSMIPGAGNGLFAVRKFKNKEYITEFCGATMSHADALLFRRYRLREASYTVTLSYSHVDLVCRNKPTVGRPGGQFANGAMDRKTANARKIVIEHKDTMCRVVVLQAIKDIGPGDEITFDYGTNAFFCDHFDHDDDVDKDEKNDEEKKSALCIFTDVPAAIASMIFSFMSMRDYCAVHRTCTRMRSISRLPSSTPHHIELFYEHDSSKYANFMADRSWLRPLSMSVSYGSAYGSAYCATNDDVWLLIHRSVMYNDLTQLTTLRLNGVSLCVLSRQRPPHNDALLPSLTNLTSLTVVSPNHVNANYSGLVSLTHLNVGCMLLHRESAVTLPASLRSLVAKLWCSPHIAIQTMKQLTSLENIGEWQAGWLAPSVVPGALVNGLPVFRASTYCPFTEHQCMNRKGPRFVWPQHGLPPAE